MQVYKAIYINKRDAGIHSNQPKELQFSVPKILGHTIKF